MVPAAELVLPPLSPVLVGRPYASIPLLAAYAEQRGAPPVRQVNLNQAYVRTLFLEAAVDGVPRQVRRAGDSAADAAEQALVEAFPGAVAARPDDAVLLAAVARDPAARRWLFERAGLGEETGEVADVGVGGYLARTARLDGMRGFLTRYYLQHGVPRVVGISVPFSTQLTPALLLAQVVREVADGEVFVVVGGPLPSLLDDSQVERILRDSAVDGVVRREGEEAFQKLLALESFDAAALDTVPSLSHRAGQHVRARPPAGAPRKLADTKPQAFDPGYLDGAVELPVVVGRGCFYTCSFCDYIELYDKINFRRAEEVAEAARLAAAQSTTGRLHFVYEVMSLKYERRLARVLAEARLGVRWRGFQRVFGDLTPEDVRLLEESGCSRLDIGLESADDRTLELMNKGYTRAEIGSFLRSFAGSRVQLLINIIVDYPGLTYERAMEAADFLDEATRDIEDVHFEVLRFVLGRNSEMFRTPEKFGLEVIRADGVDSPTQVAFRSAWTMSDVERERVEARYRDINAGFRRRRAEAAVRAGLLSADAPPAALLDEWELRAEPVVVTRSDAVGSDSVVVRNLHTGETFALPQEYESLLHAYRAAGTEPLSTFLTDAGDCLWRSGMTVPMLLELLVDLDLVRRRSRPLRAAVRTGISSDRGFYRGGVRASSPGVAR